MKEQDLTYLLSEIGNTSIVLLIFAGILFGISFTYSHFWSINKYILNGGAFKKKIFALTFIRLIVFAVALMLAGYPNNSGLRIILFFIGFMGGRIFTMRLAKKEFF